MVAADGSATLLDAENWAEKARIETTRPLHCVAWTRDSSRLALGDAKGRILIYANDLSGKPRRLLGHTGPVVSAIFSQSGETMITGGQDQELRFWDLQTGHAKMVIYSHTRNIRAVSFGREGNVLMTADAGGVIRLWPAGLAAASE